MKWIGAILILAACAGTGLWMAGAYRREEELLDQVYGDLQHMEWALNCHAWSLPTLFWTCAQERSGALSEIYGNVARMLDDRAAPDAHACMQLAVQTAAVGGKCRKILELLGRSLGEFQLDGQLRQLASVREECARVLAEHRQNRDNRIRCYQALGICGGFALAILLI